MDKSTVSTFTSSGSCPDCHANLACQLCHDLLECNKSYLWGRHLTHREWVLALRARRCQGCNIILEVLEKIKPQILDEHGSASGNNIQIVPQAKGLVWIDREEDGLCGIIAEFQVYSPQEPAIGHSNAFQDLAQTPGAETTWKFIRRCLSCCMALHQKCHAHYDSTWMPKRLLLIDNKQAVPGRLWLIDTREHSVTGRYVALSYVWGSGPKFVATRETLPILRSGIDQVELPATMRDCATVAVQLGIKYVWIDALCIMQDDKDDWAVQSQQMSRVFENALFVVGACSSPNTSTPFLGPHAPSTRLDSRTLKLGSLGEDVNHVRARDVRRISHMWLMEEPLEGRGWTWQERKLSSRMINFMSAQVVWTCKEAKFAEHGMISDNDQSPWSMEVTTRSDTEDDLSSTAWLSHMEDFSSRELTYATDRLPAVSGMVARFHAVRQCDYYAGLWADDFPQCLGWFYQHHHHTPTVGPDEVPLALNNGVPSWSWASIRGRVKWTHTVPGIRNNDWEGCYPLRIETDSELLEADCKPTTHNQFGEVSAESTLKLRGKVVEALMECDGFGRGLVRREGFAPQLVQPDCLLTPDRASLNDDLAKHTNGLSSALGRANQAESDHDPSLRIQGKVVCMLLYSIFDDEKNKNSACVLILCEAGVKNTSYRRVAAGVGHYGPAYRHRQDWKQWEGWTGLEEWDD